MMTSRLPAWFRRLRRNGWRVDRCDLCGHRFRWRRDARHGDPTGRLWHRQCAAAEHWHRTATERLAVLGVVMELAALDPATVKGAIELRADDIDERVQVSNRAFRVFHDLERRHNPEPPA